MFHVSCKKGLTDGQTKGLIETAVLFNSYDYPRYDNTISIVNVKILVSLFEKDYQAYNTKPSC